MSDAAKRLEADWLAPRLDVDLAGLLEDRRRLQRELGPMLARAGPSHPQRQLLNRRRRAATTRLKRALRLNADAIAARVLALADAGALNLSED